MAGRVVGTFLLRGDLVEVGVFHLRRHLRLLGWMAKFPISCPGNSLSATRVGSTQTIAALQE
ncbi:hypothetical protein Kim5_PA00062 (plasmid) [Rhizobium sp. Kim5]|nr:hypothetical protein Kim5_PA00062 [Rhizobium sp. Kim5]